MLDKQRFYEYSVPISVGDCQYSIHNLRLRTQLSFAILCSVLERDLNLYKVASKVQTPRSQDCLNSAFLLVFAANAVVFQNGERSQTTRKTCNRRF